MKSLNDRYTESHSNTHETFADLIFCALIVMVLFVMTLVVEVSQRVRAEFRPLPEVAVVEDIQTLSREEVAELSERLQRQRSAMERQQQEIARLREQAARQSAAVEDKIAALNGEQRFTGLTEPASLSLAYDYKNNFFYFVPSKDVAHADTSLSGETAAEYQERKVKELVAIAVNARKRRGFTVNDTKSLYQAFSQYQEIQPSDTGYSVKASQLGISYHKVLCGFIAGDVDAPRDAEALIVSQALKVYSNVGDQSDAMHPRCRVLVDSANRTLTISGVVLSPRDMRDILLALGGRGAMLDLEGYDGPPPEWLIEEVLTPTGYVGKTPKLPSE